VSTIQDARFATTLELAVRFGKTLVVDEVDSVEPILYTVLRRDLLRQGTRLLVQIGDKTVRWLSLTLHPGLERCTRKRRLFKTALKCLEM
jgi:hypothetical protein